MKKFDYDVFVIGAGSGGVRASRLAAQHGLRVGIAEARDLGGTCVNVGCIPKKLFYYGAQFGNEFHDAIPFGWQCQHPTFHWPTLRDNKSKEVRRLNTVYQNLLDKAAVRIHQAQATLCDEHTLQLDNKIIRSEKILITTGSWPSIPKFEGNEHVITSNEVFYLQKFPDEIVIMGGGYIAVEFAGIFSALGARTHLLYRRAVPLRGFDDDVRNFVVESLREQGIHLHFNAEVTCIEKKDNRYHITCNNGTKLQADQVMAATGRHPLTADLNLKKVGVKQKENGAIVVNDGYQTNIPSIYALGDVIDRMKLTPVAISEANVFARKLIDPSTPALDYTMIPTAVFCHPNIGTVGLTQAQASAQGIALKIYQSVFTPLKHQVTGRHEKTLMKLITDANTDKVLGAHMVGYDAGEIIQGIAIAIKAGASKATFDATIAVHPSIAEEFVLMRESTEV